MDERFFISDTNIPPYHKVEVIDFNLTISGTDTVDSKEEWRKYYLVIKAGAGQFPWVKLSTAGLTASGVSVQVSKLDPMDVPIKWRTEITFEDVDARSADVVFPFGLKFAALNNIYVLTPRNRKGGCFLQIYTP